MVLNRTEHSRIHPRTHMRKNTFLWFVRLFQVAVHVGSLLHLAWLFWAVPAGKLGGDPVPELIHYLGIGGLRLVMLSLLITPLVRWTSKPLLNRLRRPLGLWAFTWVTLHFAAWVGLDLLFAWSLIGEEIVKRTYILVGFTVWLILLALSITSIPRLVRAMGWRWKALHRLIYPAVILACIHFWWSLKSGWIEPAIYLGICVFLISMRFKVFRFVTGYNTTVQKS